MQPHPSFAELARERDPGMDDLALAIAGEFRVIDADLAIAALDDLGARLAHAVGPVPGPPAEVAVTCGRVLGRELGFTGERERYDDPDNSMLDVVLERRRGLPILLSIVYLEAARRADIPLAGVGLGGHFVVGHFGADPPILLDPFGDGVVIDAPVADPAVRPWHPHEIALRMLNNLVAGFGRRGDLTAAIRAAQMRLELPVPRAPREQMNVELRALQARLN